MPKNQFQRPAPVKHTRNVPRHGAPQPAPAKGAAKPQIKPPLAGLPPLSALIEPPGRR